ncbi:unnamed protein product (mitochondrion) [Plasmodiophora brassicae]|uniref:Anaphase-promoting complex subunit 4 WD40 domain-containing protein n=1 Tax=Plasmodiophora brassicae TaxID=37360 RepID=A0A3P3YKI8_PLABS|nr:unnamed protein product [Plasmodiophora brassicae]
MCFARHAPVVAVVAGVGSVMTFGETLRRGRQWVRLQAYEFRSVEDVAWGRDGRIAVAADGQRVWLGARSIQVADAVQRLRCTSGHIVAAGIGFVSSWDPATLRQQWRYAPDIPSVPVAALDVSNDGSVVVVVLEDGSTTVLHLQSGDVMCSLPNTQHALSRSFLQPEGSPGFAVASLLSARAITVQRVGPRPSATVDLSSLVPEREVLCGLQASGSFLVLMFVSGRTAIWDVLQTSNGALLEADFGANVSCVEWHPCAKLAAIADGAGRVHILGTE